MATSIIPLVAAGVVPGRKRNSRSPIPALNCPTKPFQAVIGTIATSAARYASRKRQVRSFVCVRRFTSSLHYSLLQIFLNHGQRIRSRAMLVGEEPNAEF